MVDEALFKETNTVHSLAVYEWERKIDFLAATRLCDQLFKILGSQPDFLTLVGQEKYKSYRYRNYIKKRSSLIDGWEGIGFCWWRRKGILSEDSIQVSFDVGRFAKFYVHIDECAVPDVMGVYKKVLDLLVAELAPIYGIGYRVPFYWGPSSFAIGQGYSRFATVDRTFYGSPKEIQPRNYEFGRVFRRLPGQRQLETKLRDVFEINLLSAGHLSQKVGNGTLAEWIERDKIGDLVRLSDVTWLWSVPPERIEAVRPVILGAGLMVITS
ncbi:hypothetical protein EDE05_103235 [Neorhizobium sp. R1-B]|jgi:hypothetical protein|uniref:hypothetical protein n=1 Tax=unclassified Neorhizobium TaxID=2629175 RepID=UPI0010E990F3|nr:MULTISPECIES: hypothetical protein [unclassified Neorhizobium]TCV74480.1 hypothetical protein EDE09_102235 [Neorhizobium sp. S3-V5DH]TDX87666.1 hypothetical protein EDE05_103235 [Neorhizobium sp. R1-B]